MNLFTARLTGKILSTEKFEKHVQDTQARIMRYRQIEQSVLLKEYFDLKEKIESKEFQEEKKTLISRKYKDTDEGRKMLRYKELKSSRRIKRYQHALEDPTFQAFLAFCETEDFAKIKSFKARLRSSELRLFNRLNNSSYYKNYLKVLNSSELEQLAALEKEINTQEFQERHELWADKKRWQHSMAFVREQRFNELAKMDDIKFYLAQDKAYIEWAESFTLTLDEDMSDAKNWKPGFGYANHVLKDGHSLTNEHQAYNGGKNTSFVNGCMEIETREEKMKAAAWDAKKGFVEQDFNYTSDVMNTKGTFAQEQGLFMVKMCTQGVGGQFFGLSSGKPGKPMIALYYFNGKKLQSGVVVGDKTRLTTLSKAMRSQYFVYSLRWTKKELVLYVNNMEVLRMENTLSAEELFFLAQSFLPKKNRAGKASMKVQWIRVYKAAE